MFCHIHIHTHTFFLNYLGVSSINHALYSLIFQCVFPKFYHSFWHIIFQLQTFFYCNPTIKFINFPSLNSFQHSTLFMYLLYAIDFQIFLVYESLILSTYVVRVSQFLVLMAFPAIVLWPYLYISGKEWPYVNHNFARHSLQSQTHPLRAQL